MGKGFALRVGFNLAKGDLIGFIDGDGQIRPEALSTAIAEFKKSNAEIIIGSKKHKLSRVSYSIFRRAISSISQIFIKAFFNIGVKDTQAGLKIFKREVIKDILPRLTINRFAVDIEILSLARYLGYEKLIEIPIKVVRLNTAHEKLDEKISLSDLAKTFWDAMSIYYRLRIVNYYSLKNRERWVTYTQPEFVNTP